MKALRGLKGATLRAIEAVNKLSEKVDEPLDLYKLLCPHTFCFAPFQETDRSTLEARMAQLHDTLSAYTQHRDGSWLRSSTVTVYKDGSHSVGLCGYLARKYPCFKLKLYAVHKGADGTEDKLDVEAQFEGNNFVDIIHYHVEKPYTRRRLMEEAGEHHQDIPVKIVISKSPRTDAVHVEDYVPLSDMKVTHKDKIESKIAVLEDWKEHPIMVGGALFAAAIDIVRKERAFAELQDLALRYVG